MDASSCHIKSACTDWPKRAGRDFEGECWDRWGDAADRGLGSGSCPLNPNKLDPSGLAAKGSNSGLGLSGRQLAHARFSSVAAIALKKECKQTPHKTKVRLTE